jgi:hypothetical protein
MDRHQWEIIGRELLERGFVFDNDLPRSPYGCTSRFWHRFDPERDGQQ